MSISKKQVAEIKAVIRDFIDNNAFAEGEDHILASYILEILKIIGWDNSKWRLKPYKDTTGKFPDVLLRNKSGGFAFIIEAKESNKSLNDSYGKLIFAQQLCNYCNAHGLYWGILTNFLEWRIYNSVQYEKDKDYYGEKILLIDKEKKQIVCTDEQLQYLFGLIEYENLNAIKGRISKDKNYYRKQEEIRENFFAQLINWRARLRNYLHQKHPKEKAAIIDNQTQKILDRFIFIAYSYKKEIISQDYLSAVLYSEKIDFYEELKKVFIELNEKFNSDIFAADKCDEWKIDDAVLEDIVPQINRIDFSQLNPNIIGEVYENYLGELLRATKKNIQVVGSKESVKRKKQGIYYTPEYIVKYIADNTIGELLKKCKTEKEIEKIKVIDIACGSGSFLLYAFDVFKNAYEDARRTKQPDIFSEISLRKKILLNNLYGVDLDERAVDIAKLNLLLKALEGLQETEKNGRKILPNLSLNIRCGNSLIYGSYKDEEIDTNGQLNFLFDRKSDFKNDIKQLIELKEKFYKEENNEEKDRIIKQVELHEEKINKYLNKDLKNYFDDTEKIKPFNFNVAFCEVMKKGGFDSVIGNPPFVYTRGKGISEKEKQYHYAKYIFQPKQLNTFSLFIERAKTLLRLNGYLGYIVPNNWLTIDAFYKLRKEIIFQTGDISLLNIRDKVFEDANVDNCIALFRNQNNTKIKIGEIKEEKEIYLKKISKKKIKSPSYIIQISSLRNDNHFSILNKIERKSQPLKTLAKVSTGLKVYQIGKGNPTQGKSIKLNRLFHSKAKRGKSYGKYLDGADVKRYFLGWSGEWLNYGDWIAEPRKSVPYSKDRILVRQIPSKPTQENPYMINAVLTKKSYYNDINSMVIFNPINYNMKYILAIINSKLISYWFDKKFDKFQRKIFPQFKVKELSIFPIMTPDINNKNDKKIHDKLVALANEMLELNKHPKENKMKIKVVDLEIDELVYSLYGINEREKKIIEESSEN